MTTPEPLADSVWRFRHEPLDLNVVAIAGDDRVVLVDTGPSPAWARGVAGWITGTLGRTVTDVVSTHWHWDHVFGNQVFPGATCWAHPETLGVLAGPLDAHLADARRWLPAEAGSFDEVRAGGGGSAVADRAVIDLGGRTLDVVHPGPGHTLGDLAVHVPDAGILVAGDLLEQGAPPQFDDADPVRWPDAVATLIATDAEIFVPGHGAPMRVDEVATQLADLRWVAEFVTGAEPPVTTRPYPESTLRIARRRAGGLRSSS